MDRKTFIHSAVRFSILGIMALLAGFLVIRRNVVTPGTCSRDSICGDCPGLKTCRKPEALKLKKNG